MLYRFIISNDVTKELTGYAQQKNQDLKRHRSCFMNDFLLKPWYVTTYIDGKQRYRSSYKVLDLK